MSIASLNNLCLLVICVVFHTTECSEPPCSKFAYDEQLLEKMVRMEFKMETFVNEVKASHDEVKKELATQRETVIDQFEAIQKERDNIKTEFETLKQELKRDVTAQSDEMKNVFKDNKAQITRMAEDLRHLENDTVKKLTDLAVTPPVAFKARDVADISPDANQIIVFTITLLNEGQGYDKSTGIFTAPVAGLYLLTVQFCTLQNQHMYYSIVVDDAEHAVGKMFYGSHYGCGSADAVAVMKSGSRAWVKRSKGSGTNLNKGSDRWNTFSGFLVHK